MFTGPIFGTLSIRAAEDGGRVLEGRFPYGSRATVSDGGRRGRPRKETFKPHAFQYRIEKPDEDIHLLVGHDYGKPLASKLNGGLQIQDTAEAVTFTASIQSEVAATSHAQDAFALLSAGLAVGISPGFRIPPERAVKDAETIVEEDPSEGNALIRVINSALLYELSIVTRPAYEESSVEEREARERIFRKYGNRTVVIRNFL